MTTERPDEPKVLDALTELLSLRDDLTTMTDDRLVAAVLQAREARKDAERTAAVELSRRGWSWARIGKAMGVDPSTAYRWVHPRES
ncbi:helix-turn-helix domain-containing protein [Pseudonocardia sp. McavD-2-B]|uniref:helix-turn-helix domain-containing protein n=1 Tax=Pseudonocardia sp. McavD-2-B TaxID=2954499 RepID=UPI00209724A5|nr:helix-turn-helix domain-containing protein [Pseudonocardia sp. McavD-2-B]MCO7194948.1 helix-turn-helix domain-containing protein [Pseudonocardia sp. McavD-2-B]